MALGHPVDDVAGCQIHLFHQCATLSPSNGLMSTSVLVGFLQKNSGSFIVAMKASRIRLTCAAGVPAGKDRDGRTPAGGRNHLHPPA